MAMQLREPNSGGSIPETEELNAVFVNTSLNTYLVIAVSKSDTVSDFRKKIVLEHLRCFPDFGEIKIHSLKVEDRGNSYYLSDVIPVCTVFQRVEGNWFLAADSSATFMSCLNPNSSEQDASDTLKTDLRRSSDDNCRILSDDVNRAPIPVLTLPNAYLEKNVEVENSMKKTPDSQCDVYSAENSMQSESRAKKKHKTRHYEYVSHGPNLEDNHTIIYEHGKDTSQAQMLECGNQMVDAVEEASEGNIELDQQEESIMSKVNADLSGFRSDLPVTDDRLVLDGTTVARKINIESVVHSQNLLASSAINDEATMLDSASPQNTLAEKSEFELGQNVPVDHLEGFIVREPKHSARSVDDGNMRQYSKSDGNKKGNKTKRAVRNQDSPYLLHANKKGESVEERCIVVAAKKSNIESIVNYPEISESDRTKEGIVLENEKPENIVAAKSDRVYCVEVVNGKESNLSVEFIDSSGAKQNTNSDSKKRRKQAKKAAVELQDTSDVEHVGEEKSIVDSQYLLASDKRKDDIMQEDEIPFFMIRESVKESGQNVPTKHFEDITIKEPNAGLIDTSGAMADAKSNGKKSKSKKAQKTAKEIQDASYMQNETGKGESIEPNTETCKFVNKEEERLFSLNRDNEVTVSSYNKTSECVDPDLIPKGTSISFNLLDANIIVEPKISSSGKKKKKKRELDANIIVEPNISSSSKKKKKREKKIAETNLEKLSMQKTDDGMSGSAVLFRPDTDLIPKETGKELLANLLDVSAGGADEKVQSAMGNEADIIAPLTAQNLENVAEMGKINQSPVIVKENQNLEVSQKEKNSGSIGKKLRKDRKKSELTASEVHENFPVKDKKINVEVLETEKKLTSFRDSEQQCRDSSSPIIPDSREENIGGINFKQYFVPDRSQQKVASGNKVKEATKSTDEVISVEKVEKQSLPSTTIEKHNEIHAASSHTRRAKTHLVNKSSSERSETFPENKRDKKQQSNSDKNSEMVMRPPQNRSLFTKPGTNKMLTTPQKKGLFTKTAGPKEMIMKTPQKKSFLAKPGSIFQDNSDEDSVYDYGIVDSYAGGGQASSDSSSESDDSDGESEMSHYSTRNGFSDQNGRSKLDLSTMSMDMILRSSKQFKKAKLRASQTELEQDDSQQVDLFPDGQP